MRNNTVRAVVLRCIGIALSIIPPLACILLYFPVWVAKGGEYVLSGFTLLLIAVALLPLYRRIRELLRSPSAYMLWLIAFVVFFTLSRIADEMTVISFVGFLGNLVGAIFFRLAKRVGGDTE